mgnify:CR=1 FL=1
MERLKIYIADGHHRYQAMLTIRDRLRALHPQAGPEAPWEYIMMFLVNSEHEGLTILPRTACSTTWTSSAGAWPI